MNRAPEVPNNSVPNLVKEFVPNVFCFVFSEIFCKSLGTIVKRLSLKVSNPFNGASIPVFVYQQTEAMPQLYSAGCDSCLILPDASELNTNISNDLGLKIVSVISNSR